MSDYERPLPTTDAAVDVTFTPVRDGDASAQREQGTRLSSPAGSHGSQEKRSNISDTSSRHANGVWPDSVSHGSPKYRQSPPQRVQKSGGFLLDSLISHGQPRERDLGHNQRERIGSNGSINVEKRRTPQGRFSGESSHRSSPLSREVLQDESISNASRTDFGSRPPSMDPAQLVQMALTLSESRKRNVSGTLPVPVTSASGTKVLHGVESGYGTVRLAPSNIAQRSNRLSGVSHRQHEHSPPASNVDMNIPDSGTDITDHTSYTFSPATLSRAEKARKYFELASEHRRLLEYLPPMKSSPSTHRISLPTPVNNFKFPNDFNRESPASDANHNVGRAYNPLQALRNRRLRNRERRPLPAPSDTWQDTEIVKAWVDDVAVPSRDSLSGLNEDHRDLPEYPGESQHDEKPLPSTSHSHRRTDTVGSIVTRSTNGWTIEPSELLADTYWTEKGINRGLLEDRRGHRIYPMPTRLSGEMTRSGSHADYGQEAATDKRSLRSLSEDDSKVRHRRRNKIPIAGRIRRHRLPHMSRPGSVTSLSDGEGRRPPPLLFGNNNGGDENIGPLERHMRDMIAQDEKGELSSPELLSPDHWDAHPSRLPVSRNSIDKRLRDPRRHTNSRSSTDGNRHRRARSAEGRVRSFDQGMSSMDELASDTPSSPVIPALIPPMSLDLTPLPDRTTSTPDRKARPSKLPIFRSRSKEREHIEQNGFSAPLSPGLSGDQKVQSVNAGLKVPRPSPPKRHLTAESISTSFRRFNTSSTTATSEVSAKDSGTSGGTRFFKGGRIGELVRNEGSRFGERFRPRDRVADAGGASDVSRAASDVSDTEDSTGQRLARANAGSADEDEISPRGSFERDRQSQNPRYFLPNLPIFNSSGAKDKKPAEGLSFADVDPVAAQQRAQREAGRSPRFERLAPPKINLPDDEQGLDTDSTDKDGRLPGPRRRWGNLPFRPPTSSRKNSVTSLGAPGSMTRQNGHLPVTGLYGTVSSESKRHWSISDQAPPEQVKRVTMRDIARVRALLLASGVKAHEIVHLANTPREPPLPPVAQAAATVGQEVHEVARKEEIVVAARMLSDHISSTTNDFHHSLVHFRNERARVLTAQLEQLQQRASDQLTILVHEASDDADAFTVELTTKQPQDVKRVDDAVNYMFRQRRRRFRLVRRTGFKVLEWMLLGIMWWVWFVVVLFQTTRRILWTILVFLRWLLWF